ncbi:hypothetical protein NM688_g3103 [Phlebia brevispora]|uniref:Uncharacterized protein n=1 Tax=Phlebia brevispora TaxID=194682 RepID=A0ACC1T6T7_9APHY|nr:hypothetical protein NM688_g3103 [Phlebia brevispora]
MSETTIEKAIAYAAEERVVYQASFAVIALIIYEHLITLDSEIKSMWRTQWSWSRCIFLFNRCKIINYLGYIIGVCQIITIALFSALRTYAFCSANIAIPSLVFALNLLPLATDLVRAMFQPSRKLTGIEISDHMTLSSRVSVILADTIVLVVTWLKTLRPGLAALRTDGAMRLVTLVLRDGTIYFIAMLAMNVAMIVLTEVPTTKLNDPISLFITSLTPILISRFLLNLRRADEASMATDPSISEGIYSTWRVSDSKILGDLGQPLDYESEAQDKADEPEPETGACAIETVQTDIA